MAQSYNSFARAFESALGNVTRAQDAALKREALTVQTQAARFGLEANQANRAISFLDSIDGFMDLNAETGLYELGEGYLEAFQKMNPNTRQYILNTNTSLNEYINTKVREGSGVEQGEIGGPIVINKNKQGKPLVPTSLTDRRAEAEASGNADALAAVDKDINDWISSGKSVVMVPLKRKDGKFSFFTRNRTDREDDNTLLLSGAEFGSLLQGRINQLYTAINPTASRKAQAFSDPDIQQALGITGTGTAGVTTDTVMDDIQITGQQAYNSIDNPNSQLRGADQSEGLQSATALIQKGISADKLAKWNDYKAAGANQTSSIAGVSDVELLRGIQSGGQYDFYNLSADEQREVLRRLGGNALGSRVGLNKKLQDELRNSGNVPMRRTTTDSVDKRAINQYRAQFGGDVIDLSDDEVAERIRQSTSPRFKKYQTPRTEIGLETDASALTKEQFMDGIDMSQYPDLSKVTTKKAALDLVNSGNLQSFMSDDLVASYKIALQNAGVNSGESFNQAVEDKKIQNPFLASLVVANALAGPETTESDVRSLATSLVNNIKTGDPSVDSGELLQLAEGISTTRNDFLKWKSEQSSDYLDDLKDKTADISDQWDNFQLAFKDGDPQNTYTNALSSTLGLLDELKQNGYSDTLIALKTVDPTLTRKVGDGISRAIYQQLGSNWNIFTKDFWGDIPAPNDPAALGGYMERLAFRKDARGRVVELVRTKNVIGGRKGTIMVEAEGSANMQTVVDRLNPETLNILKRFIPTLGPENFKTPK
tara:strand:+ start:1898 stop:4201 length:2304 start_codon:yes stop_codon:yes gene_type:complete